MIFLVDFTPHETNATKCVDIGRKSGQVFATGGSDHEVRLFAVGQSQPIMVRLFIILFLPTKVSFLNDILILFCSR